MRSVCAWRSPGGGQNPLEGDFAYLRTRRVAWDDVIYELDHPAIWTLVQLRYDRPLLRFDPTIVLQVSCPTPDQPLDPRVIYVPLVTPEALEHLRQHAAQHLIVVNCPTPALLRDQLNLPAIAIEQTPLRLLAEFPRLVAGI